MHLPKIDGRATRIWREKSNTHRIGGPAVEMANANMWWYKNNKRHRIEGPANEWPDGLKWWFKTTPHRWTGG